MFWSSTLVVSVRVRVLGWSFYNDGSSAFRWRHFEARLPLLDGERFAWRLVREGRAKWQGNYASWSYKIHQYLLGHSYWSYVEGANDTTPESTHRDFPAWEQSESRVLYCFTSCVGEQLLSYIRDVKTPKGAWENPACMHHSQEASVLTGVEQPTTTRFVGGRLYLED
mgnify:FL=1